MIESNVILTILREIFRGITQSLNIIKLSMLIYKNVNLQKNMFKLFKHNLILYILPAFIMILINIPFNYFYYLYVIIDTFSGFFHLLYYFDISNTIINSIPSKRKIHDTDPMTNGLTMTLYQLTTIITIGIIDFTIGLFNVKFSYVIKFFLLSMYHAIFVHNNLWQNMGLSITVRIDIYQKMWPYYLGYGIIPSILYMQSNILIKGIYNIYIGILISISMLNRAVLPTSKIVIPKITLKFIEYMMVLIYGTVSYCVVNILNIIN